MTSYLIAPGVRAPQRRPQRGYSLLELSIVLVIMALVIMSVIAMQIDQARTTRARDVAQMYTRLNNAVGTYMVNNYDKLVKLDASCTLNPYSTNMNNGYNHAAHDNPAICQLTVNGRTFQNGMQPTLQELRAYGVLGDYSGNEPPLPVNTTDYILPFPRDLAAGQSRWMVLIRKLCIGDGGGWSGPGDPYFVENAGGYKGCRGSTDLESLVFNVHPYAVNSLGGSVFLSQILQFMGPDGYLSDLVDPATGKGEELRAMRGSVFPSVINPMRTGMGEGSVYGGTGTPLPFILAMRNGYNSSGWDKYVRRDGSTPMTSNWDYGNTNITNVSNMAVNNTATVGNVNPDTKVGTGTFTVNGNTNLNGTVTVGDPSANANTAPGQLLVNGTSKVTGNSTVGGNLSVTGNSTVTGNSSVTGDNIVNGISTLNGAVNVKDSLTIGSPEKMECRLRLVGGCVTVPAVPGTLTVNGVVNADKGVFGTVTDTVTEAVNAALKAASAYIQGSLTVAGNAFFKKDIQVDGSANITGNLTTSGYVFAKEGIVMNKYKWVGFPCDPAKESLALQGMDGNGATAFNAGLRLVVCTFGSKVWEYPQPDLQGKIDTINTTLTTLAGKDASLEQLIKDMKDGKVQGSLQQQIDNLLQAIKDMKDGNVNGSLQQQINNLVTSIKNGDSGLQKQINDMKDPNLNGSLQWQIIDLRNNMKNSKNNIQGHYFTINYTAHSCAWAGSSCFTGGAVYADPSEWDATVTKKSGNGVSGSGHIDNKGDHYWLDLYYAQDSETADIHIRWTSRVAQPLTSPANLSQIASHGVLTKECSLDWLNWTYDASWNHSGPPQLLYSCDVTEKSGGFSWKP